MNPKTFSLSIVSHGHKEHLVPLLDDLASALGRTDFEVIVTCNLPDDLGIDYQVLPFPSKLIHNLAPKTFAENHNAAFAANHDDYFVVLNPDIWSINDPFDLLPALLLKNPNSVCAPLIVHQHGRLEDSARNLPTPLFLVKKLLAKIFKIRPISDFMPLENKVSMPDWVAEMFIAVPRRIYRSLSGLDERYRTCFEDVDFLCTSATCWVQDHAW